MTKMWKLPSDALLLSSEFIGDRLEAIVLTFVTITSFLGVWDTVGKYLGLVHN